MRNGKKKNDVIIIVTEMGKLPHIA